MKSGKSLPLVSLHYRVKSHVAMRLAAHLPSRTDGMATVYRKSAVEVPLLTSEASVVS